jgi:hypothetical protein
MLICSEAAFRSLTKDAALFSSSRLNKTTAGNEKYFFTPLYFLSGSLCPAK